MKGVIMIEFVIVAAIFTLGVIFLTLVPVFLLKVHIVKVVQFEYKYNNAQLSLLTLLLSTNDGKNVFEMLSNHIKLNEPQDTSFLKEKLDNIVDTKCYELSSGEKTIVKQSQTACAQQYTATMKVPLPYKPLAKKSTPTCSNAVKSECGEIKVGETRGGGAAEKTQYWICSDECDGTQAIGCTKEIENLKLEGLTCCPLQSTGEWRESQYGEWMEKCPEKITINKNLVQELKLVIS